MYNEFIKWKTWEEQGRLKLEIRDWIDTGACRKYIVDNVSQENPDKWTRKEIHQAITELKKDLLICHVGHDYYKVTEWAHDAATHCRDYGKALWTLVKARVYHRDMEDYGITKDGVLIEEKENV